GRAVRQQELHPRLVLVDAAQLAALEVAAQLHELGGRAGQVHVDRVELLDGGERLRLAGRDEGARGHRGTPDSSTDGGGDAAVLEVDPGRLQGRLGRRHVGLRLREGCARIVTRLATDRIDARELLVPAGRDLRA